MARHGFWKRINPFGALDYRDANSNAREQLLDHLEPLQEVMDHLRVKDISVNDIPDKDLRDVVSAVYFLNDKLLELSQAIEKIKEASTFNEEHYYQSSTGKTKTIDNALHKPTDRQIAEEKLFKIKNLTDSIEDVLRHLGPGSQYTKATYQHNFKKHYEEVLTNTKGKDNVVILAELQNKFLMEALFREVNRVFTAAQQGFPKGEISKDDIEGIGLKNSIAFMLNAFKRFN